MSRVNERSFLVQYELRQCACGLIKSMCNSKQKWKHDECWCECQELDEWDSCKKDYLCNPNTCDCVILIHVSAIRHVNLTNNQIVKIKISNWLNLTRM